MPEVREGRVCAGVAVFAPKRQGARVRRSSCAAAEESTNPESRHLLYSARCKRIHVRVDRMINASRKGNLRGGSGEHRSNPRGNLATGLSIQSEGAELCTKLENGRKMTKMGDRTMEYEACVTCKFWSGKLRIDNDRPPEYGECRRNPPRVDTRTPGNDPNAQWPTTMPDHWCGEYLVSANPSGTA